MDLNKEKYIALAHKALKDHMLLVHGTSNISIEEVELHVDDEENDYFDKVVEIESLEIENEEADEQEGNAPKVDEGGKTVSDLDDSPSIVIENKYETSPDVPEIPSAVRLSEFTSLKVRNGIDFIFAVVTDIMEPNARGKFKRLMTLLYKIEANKQIQFIQCRFLVCTSLNGVYRGSLTLALIRGKPNLTENIPTPYPCLVGDCSSFVKHALKENEKYQTQTHRMIQKPPVPIDCCNVEPEIKSSSKDLIKNVDNKHYRKKPVRAYGCALPKSEERNSIAKINGVLRILTFLLIRKLIVRICPVLKPGIVWYLLACATVCPATGANLPVNDPGVNLTNPGGYTNTGMSKQGENKCDSYWSDFTSFSSFNDTQDSDACIREQESKKCLPWLKSVCLLSIKKDAFFAGCMNPGWLSALNGKDCPRVIHVELHGFLKYKVECHENECQECSDSDSIDTRLSKCLQFESTTTPRSTTPVNSGNIFGKDQLYWIRILAAVYLILKLGRKIGAGM